MVEVAASSSSSKLHCLSSSPASISVTRVLLDAEDDECESFLFSSTNFVKLEGGRGGRGSLSTSPEETRGDASVGCGVAAVAATLDRERYFLAKTGSNESVLEVASMATEVANEEVSMREPNVCTRRRSTDSSSR